VFFTAPVDRAAAENLASWGVTSFTYKYHHVYGSPVINQSTHGVRAAVVARDGRSVRIAVDSLRQGYVHEIKMSGVKSDAGAALLHDVGYYTVNQIPRGQVLAVRPAPARTTATNVVPGTTPTRVPESTPPTTEGVPPNAPRAGAAPNTTATTNETTSSALRESAPAPAPASASASAAGGATRRVLGKHQTTMPAEWNGTVDQTVSVQGVEGLKFSLAAFDVKAGARVKLDFANVSDMLHNLVVVKPGTAIKVGEQAMRMGLEGAKLEYVPRTDDVLYYTSVLEPEKSQTIYFVAPTTPGEYTYVCTFPGHYIVMQGRMRVGR